MTTLPTPAMTPSAIRLENAPSPSAWTTTAAERRGGAVDQVHDRRRPGEHGLEHDGHDDKQADRAGNRPVEKTRNACAPRIKRRRPVLHIGEHSAHPGVANPCVAGDRWLDAEQLVAHGFEFLLRLGAEFFEERPIRRRRTVDQQAFEFGKAQRLFCTVGELARRRGQLRPHDDPLRAAASAVMSAMA